MRLELAAPAHALERGRNDARVVEDQRVAGRAAAPAARARCGPAAARPAAPRAAARRRAGSPDAARSGPRAARNRTDPCASVTRIISAPITNRTAPATRPSVSSRTARSKYPSRSSINPASNCPLTINAMVDATPSLGVRISAHVTKIAPRQPPAKSIHGGGARHAIGDALGLDRCERDDREHQGPGDERHRRGGDGRAEGARELRVDRPLQRDHHAGQYAEQRPDQSHHRDTPFSCARHRRSAAVGQKLPDARRGQHEPADDHGRAADRRRHGKQTMAAGACAR